MRELSLHILDVVQNSIKAGAGLITVEVSADVDADTLTIGIADDGCGMTPEFLAVVTDPFTTTRTTRKAGMGLPLFKAAAETAGGAFRIDSAVGRGTTVFASFLIGSIDRAPMGDLAATVVAIITSDAASEFVFTYSVGGASFSLDTREIKAAFDGVPLNDPLTAEYLTAYVKDNIAEVNNGVVI
jgi:hypothetical protein